MKKSKIWLGVGVAVVASASPAANAGAPDFSNTTAVGNIARSDRQRLAQTFSLAQQNVQGQGGENETGEGGVDAAAADKDPVKYGIALQVIAAHYYAGLAAYEAGEVAAGTQMFAHGHAEVYVELEEVFKKRGVRDLGAKIETAIAAANTKAPSSEVKKAVDAVLAAIVLAERAGPKSGLSALAVKAQVVADMLDRAAAQNVLASKKEANFETYLDGLGFAMAAKVEGQKILPELEKANLRAANAIRAGLELAASAFPGIKRGATVDAAKFLAAASTARVATSGLR